jgi:serine-type D-Ala-D-Ala carboxypeptidase/endopeptidase
LTDFPGPAEFPARLVTIKQLATHNSGLPRLPSNMGFWWLLRYRKDPYAHYDVDHLYRWLATARPKNRLQESAFVYSNAGIAILGQVLALAGNTSFESLLTTQVLSVLGLSDTGFSLDNEQQARLTAGHNRRGTMVSNWHWRVFASAGGLYSTSRDMGRFVSLMLGSIPNPLENEFTAAFQSHRLLSEKQSMGLAWMLDKTEVDLLVWHNGGTGGYRSFVGWYPTLKLGVCVLSSIAVSVDDLAIDLLKSVAI